jgi:hypothetical protein
MSKALVIEMEKILKEVEYLQKIVESNHQAYLRHKDLYKDVGELVANSKFYLLSAFFRVKKSLDEYKSLTLNEHMMQNRPPDLHNVTPRPIGLLYDQIEDAIGSIQIAELEKSLKYIENNAF